MRARTASDTPLRDVREPGTDEFSHVNPVLATILRLGKGQAGYMGTQALGLPAESMQGGTLAEASGRTAALLMEALGMAAQLGPKKAPRRTMEKEAYHGSGARFTRFKSEKIGTGEGAQAYGHGFYFAESPEVAKSYMKTVRWNIHDMAFETTPLKDGALYRVRIPDKHIQKMLDWDKPLAEQPEHIQKALKAEGLTQHPMDRPGEEPRMMHVPVGILIERWLKGGAPAEDLTSGLMKHGITGIRYKDASSRGKEGGTSNYVVFDPASVKILERNGKKVIRRR